MVSPSGCSRYSIVVIIGVEASAIVKVTLDGGSSDNKIFVEKADGEGGGFYFYCSYWGAMMGIKIT